MTSRDRSSAALAPIRPEVIPAELVPDRRGAVCVFSSVSRSGDWILPRNFRAVAILGSVELDLTQARLGPGTSLIEVVAVLGSVEILVPPDVRLECEGDPLIGSFEVKGNVRGATSPDAPVVRITGSAYLASVEVKVIDANAPGWLERIRARLSGEE